MCHTVSNRLSRSPGVVAGDNVAVGRVVGGSLFKHLLRLNFQECRQYYNCCIDVNVNIYRTFWATLRISGTHCKQRCRAVTAFQCVPGIYTIIKTTRLSVTQAVSVMG